jgi:hypothetical protein
VPFSIPFPAPPSGPGRRRSSLIGIIALALGLVLCSSALAETPDLKRIMADPDWIGPPVEAAWWQLDGDRYIARIKRTDSEIRDLLEVDARSGEIRTLDAGEFAALDGAEPVYDADRSRALTLRNGNLYLRDLDSGTLSQLTASGDAGAARFGAEARRVLVLLGRDWWQIDLDTRVLRPLADLRFDDAPDEETEDSLEQHQLELFSTLARERNRRIEQRQHALDTARADRGRAPEPWFLGKGMEPVFSSPSSDARWMLLAVRKAGAAEGRDDAMPRFVTESGYVEIEDVRSLVGRNAPTANQLWLLDLETRTRHELDLAALSGIDEDPLADLKAQQDIDPHDGDDPRPVSVSGIEWHPREADRRRPAASDR